MKVSAFHSLFSTLTGGSKQGKCMQSGGAKERKTQCISNLCTHKNMVMWVQCGYCSGWYHYQCVGVPASKARLNSFHFLCSSCSCWDFVGFDLFKHEFIGQARCAPRPYIERGVNDTRLSRIECYCQCWHKQKVYVPRNLRICAISRLRCAFSESRDCVL